MLFRYPALVTGTPKGFRKPRPCVIVRETDIAVRAHEEREAPVAALLKATQHVFGQETLVELPVRHVEGRFYIPDSVDPQSLPGMLSAPFLDCPIRSGFLELLNSKMPLHSMERDGVWPPGIGLYLSIRAGNHASEESIERSKDVVLTDEGQADAADVDALADSMNTHFILVDGGLWRRVPEPVYVANLGNGPLRLEMTEVLGRVDGGVAQSVVFPLTDYGTAVEVMQSFGNRVSQASPNAKVFIPEVFSDQFNVVNYARFARHLASAPCSDRIGSYLPRLLREIHEITAASVSEIDFDRLEDTVGQALAEIERVGAVTRTQPSVGMDRRIVDFHLDQWDSRTVEIASVIATPRMHPSAW
ncbi:hypothetical protein HFN89_01650 [Rhizobium laguerreae]|nr:hypothetical protein [Rhizobium laguerreae]